MEGGWGKGGEREVVKEVEREVVKEVEGFCMTFAVRVCNWPFENVVIFSRLVNVSVCVCVCVCV